MAKKGVAPAKANGRPNFIPAEPYGPPGDPLHREGSWVWAPLRKAWLQAKPEELVRQGFIYRLHTQWGFALEQMAQERRTQHGHASPKADVVIANSPAALQDNRDYSIVVETKAENVTIVPEDYGQGESYARAVGAEFLVAHNNKETSFFRLVPGAPGDRVQITGIPNAREVGDARRLEEIRRATKAFTRDEFQKLLKDCHDILRDNHKMDPGTAFDEVSKILFIKMAFERRGRVEVFTTDKLNEFARASLVDENSSEMLDQLFTVTKQYYRADQLFGENEHLRVSAETFRRIVKLLERFNLSDTGDDVKGIAFERFLGQTYRGELGQFFTPRPVVDFMVDMLDPQEGEAVCDPASGTGGFLIKTFEYVREAIEADVQRRKALARRALNRQAKKEGWSDDELVEREEAALAELNVQLDLTKKGTRLFRVSHECIFGVDAEPRAARTSKMNMIMHGDGHGGIHYFDGLVDTNGIFPNRFDVVITNPPFGATVGADQILGTTEQTRVPTDPDVVKAYRDLYGQAWEERYEYLREASAARMAVLALFDIGRDPIGGSVATARLRRSRDTEMLFLERCLTLLRPGGRMGIVLPDGILNNPSNGWLREYVAGRAKLLAVVSIPQEVFHSAKATVKTSLVFLQRLTLDEEAAWANAREETEAEVNTELAEHVVEVDALRARAARYDRDENTAATPQPVTTEDRAQRRKLLAEARVAARELEARRQELVRERFRERLDYPVFMAEAESAGITGTGDTGPLVPNELPEVLVEYRRYRADPAAYATAIEAEIAEE